MFQKPSTHVGVVRERPAHLANFPGRSRTTPTAIALLLFLFFSIPAHASQAHGSSNHGCFTEGQPLPESGPGFQSTRRHRNLHHGHAETVTVIKTIGKQIESELGRVALIGNLSHKNGGPLYKHSISHQNGLDFDISYKLPEKKLTDTQSRDFQLTSVLTTDKKAIDPKKWTPAALSALKITAQQPQVQRVLVSHLIKKELCEKFPHEAWFAKIRPWWKHDDHFHVRLRCPQGNTACTDQKDPPQEVGCSGAAYEWWFSDEAEAMRQGKKPKGSGSGKKKSKPAYPDVCREVLGL